MQTRSFPDCPSSAVHERIIQFSFSLRLSTREAAVLLLTAGAGVHRKEAADRLGCRPGTVDTYWRRILRKSGLTSQLELLAALLSFSLERGPLTMPGAAAGLEGPHDEIEADRAPAVVDLASYRRLIDAAVGAQVVAATAESEEAAVRDQRRAR